MRSQQIKQLIKINLSKSKQILSNQAKYNFCLQSQTEQKKPKKNQKESKYKDDYDLSQDEINSILKKVEKKPEVMFKHEFKFNHNYDTDISEQLSEIQQLNKQNHAPYSKREMQLQQEEKLKEQHKKTEEQSKKKQQQQQQQQQQSLTPIENDLENQMVGIDEHGKQVQIKTFKYDLPIPNLPPEIEAYPDPFEDPEGEKETINERVFELLKLNENTSYQQYELALKNEFSIEEDMYGDIIDVSQDLEKQMAVKGPEQCVPRSLLSNQEFMDHVRRCMTVNLNMPGVMENEHPHKFITNLRPIEEFRNTPIIPISDKQMKDFKDRVEAYHRRGFYFEIKKETIYQNIMLGACLAMGLYLVKTALKKEEQIGIEVERLKVKRIKQTV